MSIIDLDNNRKPKSKGTKYFICIYILMFGIYNLKAQFSAKNIIIGGTLNARYYQIPNPNSWTTGTKFIDIRPQIGYAIKKNIVLGIELPFLYQVTSSSYFESNYKLKGLGFFIRDYYPIFNKCNLWLQTSFGYTIADLDYNRWVGFPGNGPYEFQERVLYASVMPGIAYSLSKRFQVELGVSSLLAANKISHTDYIGNGKPDLKTTITNCPLSLPVTNKYTFGCRFVFNHTKVKI